MRILALSTWFPYPPDNGSKLRAYYLLRALASGHQVTLVAFHPPDGKADAPSSVHEREGIRVWPVPVNPFRYVAVPEIIKFASPIPLAYWPSREMQRTAAHVAGSGRWDAVVVFQPFAARYALSLANAPRLLDVDTALTYQMWERHAHQHRLLARWRTWVSWRKAYRLESRLFRRFQTCTVASPLEWECVSALVDRRQSRVEVLPNGVDCRHNRPDLAPVQPNTLIFNGALTYNANYDAMRYFLAEIYPLIKKQVPEVSLTITGSTTGVNLAGLHLDPSVRLSGYVPDIRPWVASASVCVAPIRQGAGTRLKILEAMALGTPVVATAKGAEGLEVVDGQHLLLADEPAAFAERAVRLLRDPALRRLLATNARALVESRYDWEEIGGRFRGLVEETVRVHRSVKGGAP
jgi:sugar transferase (PEP-CTERM/EpsH1 system associated)